MLFKTRGITFNQVIDVIEEKGILLNFDHSNKEKYPNQKIFVVEINKYTYCVPYVIDEETIFMKTIFPNRNFLYLLEENKND